MSVIQPKKTHDNPFRLNMGNGSSTIQEIPFSCGQSVLKFSAGISRRLSLPNPMPTRDYATPIDDQISWREADHSHLLPAHLVAFLQAGVNVTLGARSAAGRPVIGIGVACCVRGREEVRVFVPKSANIPLLDAIATGSALAATFSRARDHRSMQLKAPRASILDIEPGDLSEVARQSALLADDLIELGFSRAQAVAFAFHNATDLAAIEFRPDRVFTQTPGPGAGAELRR
jgi:hypothetical protein